MNILVNNGSPPKEPLQADAIRLSIGDREAEVSARDTRETIKAKFGMPWDTGVITRKHPLPAIFVYDPKEQLEFHFEPGATGRLIRVFQKSGRRPGTCVSFLMIDAG